SAAARGVPFGRHPAAVVGQRGGPAHLHPVLAGAGAMPLRFDATLKDLARRDPAAFVAQFDAPPTEPVTLLNVDLSTVTAAAELVFGIGQPVREIIHIDCQ